MPHVFIAPYPSLANEVEISLSSIFNIMGYKVSQLYGGFQTSHIDRQLTKKANIIIVTPEKAKSMLRSNKDLKDRTQLVIVDEGHLVGFQLRYITGELLIEEVKIVLKKINASLYYCLLFFLISLIFLFGVVKVIKQIESLLGDRQVKDLESYH